MGQYVWCSTFKGLRLPRCFGWASRPSEHPLITQGVPGVQPGVLWLEGALMVGAGLVPGSASAHGASSVTNPGPVSKLHGH